MAPPRFVTAALRAAAVGGCSLGLTLPAVGRAEPPTAGSALKQTAGDTLDSAAAISDQLPGERVGQIEQHSPGKRTEAPGQDRSGAPSEEVPADTAAPAAVAAQPPAAPSAPTATGGSAQPGGSAGRGGVTGSVRGSTRPVPVGGGAVTDVRPADVRRAARPPASGSDGTSERVPDRSARETREQRRAESRDSLVERAAREVVRVVPGPIKAAVAALVAIAVVLTGGYLLTALQARRLGDQRTLLLDEIGALQAALLPEVPGRVGPLLTSVAYRPAEGPGAGGDFYDAFELDGGRVGIVLGDVAGHGREALAQTTLLRYTLRVYLETGLDPRSALKLAGRTFDEGLDASFATAIVALYDEGKGTLVYACAGHPPPLLLGPPRHEPVTVSSSPPIGIGAPTGLRQTTVPLPTGALACFFTDGLTEARLEHDLLGRRRLAELLDGLGPDATAADLLARIREEVVEAPDDMAACIVRPPADSFAIGVRLEELELGSDDPVEPTVERFLEACGVPAIERRALCGDASAIASRWGGVIVRVKIAESAEVFLSAPHVNALADAVL